MSSEALVYKVKAPSGTMFLIVEETTPQRVQIHFGKSGSNLFAWASAVAELINLNLRFGGSLNDVWSVLSGITSDKISYTAGSVKLKSDLDGIVHALLQYKNRKFLQETSELTSRKIMKKR